MAVFTMCPHMFTGDVHRNYIDHLLQKIEKGRTAIGAPFVFGLTLSYLKSNLFTASWMCAGSSAT